MSGHSKWSKVKHYKGTLDAKRGKIFAKLGKEMSVAAKHLFHRMGQFLISKDQISEDDLLAAALDAGAEDVVTHAENYEVITDPHQFEAVHKALENLKPQSAEIAQVPTTTVPVTDE